MVAVSVRQQPAQTIAVATQRTTTISMGATRVAQQLVQTIVAEQQRATTTNTVAIQAAQQLVQTTVAMVTQRTTTISMVAVQVALQHVLTIVAERLQITMTSTEAALVRQPLEETMVVELPRHITTPTAIISDQATEDNKLEMDKERCDF